MTRAIPLFLVLLLVISVTASPVPRAGDPAIDGKDYLLSDTEFRAALAVARARVAKIAPWASVRRITVISGAKLQADFGPGTNNEAHLLPYLVLERVRGQWRVTAEYTTVIST